MRTKKFNIRIVNHNSNRVDEKLHRKILMTSQISHMGFAGPYYVTKLN